MTRTLSETRDSNRQFNGTKYGTKKIRAKRKQGVCVCVVVFLYFCYILLF